MSDPTPATKPYLGKCKIKGCDYALFASPESIKDAENFSYVKKGLGAFRVGHEGVFARCTEGHKFFKLNRIEGTYSKDHKCDSRCLDAKGHKCTCSCGGMNHGRGHAVEVVEVVANLYTHATEKQEAFLRTLLDERVIPSMINESGYEINGLARHLVATMMLDAHEFTKRQASATIEWLLTLPKKEN